MDWSHFQEAIFNFVATSRKNLIIQATAGSGKTSTIVEIGNRLKGRIMFLAFNKPIAKYLKTKFSNPDVDCRTFHSLGMLLIRKFTGKNMTINNMMVWDKISAVYPRKQYNKQFWPAPMMNRIVKRARTLGFMSYNIDELEEFIFSQPGLFNRDPKTAGKERKEVMGYLGNIISLLREFDKIDGPGDTLEIDFDSMVRLPAVHKMAEVVGFPEETILLDESQDSNAYQFSLVEQLYKRGKRIIAVGDFLQSIYSFRGSYLDSMSRMKEIIDAEELPLSYTYRCKSNIVYFVNKKIAGSTMMHFFEGGEVKHIKREEMIDYIIESNTKLIIGARNSSLMEVWIELAVRKIGSSLKMTGIAEEIRRTIKDFKTEDINKIAKVIRMTLAEEAARLEEEKILTRADSDIYSCILQLIVAFNVERMNDMKKILVELEQDSDRTLGTIHFCKGQEAEKTLVLGDWFPSEQELQMRNVAYTRAKDVLCIVEDFTKDRVDQF
jgi:DNA helicase II / ATP-dependent DNA helicase PcrA